MSELILKMLREFNCFTVLALTLLAWDMRAEDSKYVKLEKLFNSGEKPVIDFFKSNRSFYGTCVKESEPNDEVENVSIIQNAEMDEGPLYFSVFLDRYPLSSIASVREDMKRYKELGKEAFPPLTDGGNFLARAHEHILLETRNEPRQRSRGQVAYIANPVSYFLCGDSVQIKSLEIDGKTQLISQEVHSGAHNCPVFSVICLYEKEVMEKNYSTIDIYLYLEVETKRAVQDFSVEVEENGEILFKRPSIGLAAFTENQSRELLQKVLDAARQSEPLKACLFWETDFNPFSNCSKVSELKVAEVVSEIHTLHPGLHTWFYNEIVKLKKE